MKPGSPALQADSLQSEPPGKSPKVKVLVTQLCLILYESPGSSVHGILQARILEWVAIPFSRGSSQPRSPALQAGRFFTV